MIKVVKIDYSGGACPFQLEGKTDDGKWIYIRYRGGWLRYVVAESHTQWMKSKKDSWYDFSKKIGGDYDGYADHDAVYPHLKEHIQFPEGFRIESYPDFQGDKNNNS